MMAKRFMHVGVPTKSVHPGENFVPGMNVFIAGGPNEHCVEWLRFAEGESCLPKEIQTMNHIAFDVDDIEAEIKGKKVIVPITELAPGVRIAFIMDHELPVEYYENKNK